MTASLRPGTVYLVGAGPGAADLITVRGLGILRVADAVLHDALVSPELLAEARADADLLYVGKRGYCVGSTTQETIHEALVRLARAGKSVCRLKCGDPCVFGRGGEEAEALAEAGIPFEIVPGVTSALGAAAAANIPLTHRDVGQSVTLATGHFDPDSPECTHDWSALTRAPTVVFYMASRHVAAIARKLMDNGLSPDTAAAVIESGTLTGQRETVAEVRDIGEQAAGVQAPAVLVVGEVVRKRVGSDLTPRPPLHEWRGGVQSGGVPSALQILTTVPGRTIPGVSQLNTPSPFMERAPGGEVSSSAEVPR